MTSFIWWFIHTWCYSEYFYLLSVIWDWVKINYSACVSGYERTCHPVQQCGHWCVFNGIWTTKVLYDTDTEKFILERICDLYTYNIVSRIYSLLILLFYGIWLAIKKNTECLQPHFYLKLCAYWNFLATF